MRIVQLKTIEDFFELYDELIVGLMQLRDIGASDHVTVESVKSMILQAETVDTKLSYRDLADIFQFTNALNGIALFNEQPELLTDARNLITIASLAKSSLYAEGRLVRKNIVDYIRSFKIPSEYKAGAKYVFKRICDNQPFGEDNAVLAYLSLLMYGVIALEEVPILSAGENFGAVKEYVYDL